MGLDMNGLKDRLERERYEVARIFVKRRTQVGESAASDLSIHTPGDDPELCADLCANASKRLAAFDAALQKITHGGFGVCAKCQKKIADARINFDPCVELCFKCQKEFEMESARNNGSRVSRWSREKVGSLDQDD